MWTGETIRMRHVLTRIFLENGVRENQFSVFKNIRKLMDGAGRLKPCEAFVLPAAKINDVENIERESKKRGRFKRVLL